MSFSIKLNKSNNISFRTRPTKSSTTFVLTLPRITLSLRVKRFKRKSIFKTYNSGTSYKPVNNVTISSLQPIKHITYITKISRLIKLNIFSNFLIPSLVLSLLPNILIRLLDTNNIISTALNRSLITFGSISINLNALITTLFILIGVIGIIIKIYVHTTGRLDYNQLTTNKELPSIWNRLITSDKLWQVIGIYELDENASKENGSIKVIYERIPVKIRYKTPFYIHANFKVLQVKLDDYTLVILPDHYIITNKSEVGIIETSNTMIRSENNPYAELDDVPEDTEVIYSTWQYVNKDSSKDKRYKDNKKVPICNYRLIQLNFNTEYKILLLSSKNE